MAPRHYRDTYIYIESVSEHSPWKLAIYAVMDTVSASGSMAFEGIMQQILD